MIVTSVQLAGRERAKAEAVDEVVALLEEARDSDLVLLPELWPCGYFSFDRYASDSEPIDGPLVRTLCEQARKHKLHLFTGSFVEQDGSDLYNTCLLLDPQGRIVTRYRKIHLFGYQSREQRLLTPGDEVAVAPTPWGPAGLSTCYDLRFPELYRTMIDRGATFFLVTAAWPRAREEAWVLFNRARAHENLAHLFSCNYAGHESDTTFGGRSLFVDPDGTILADGGADASLITHQIDPARVQAMRREFSALADRVFAARPPQKEHLEFFGIDLDTGWQTPPGYPAGIQQKILAGRLDERARTGSRSRLLRFEPGAYTTEPFEHEYWAEVLLISGSLTVGDEAFFEPFTYACRPPHVPHGPFRSDEGCLLFEVHYF